MIKTRPIPHPQAAEYLKSLPTRPPVWERDVKEFREECRGYLLDGGGEPEAVASVEDVAVNGVPARLYRPLGGECDALVWLHGGGWMVGRVQCYDSVVRALANRARCAILSVDYRLAPEHPYPAAFDDCWAATRWAVKQFDRVAVAGDSAGGNLSAAVALRARDSRVPLALQLLIYPALDQAAVDGPFYNEFRKRYEDEFRKRYEEFAAIGGFGAAWQDSVRYYWEVYVPESSRRLEPYVSPLRAASFAGVAPAVVITAEHDILRGEAEDYVRRLAIDEVPVELHNYEGQIHGFFHLLAMMDDAHDAVERSAAALRRAFSQ